MSPIAAVLPGTSRSLGHVPVQRLLPSPACRAVGPFIFLDHLGPVAFAPGAGLDVPPHPHIGLATLTYLFDGALLHRDSLGSVCEIHPGEVNWMSAGAGVAHSERTPPALRLEGARLHGLQFWAALPRQHEQDPPAFQHHPAASLPRLSGRGYTLTLLAGRGWGQTSPVHTPSPLFCADLRFTAPGCFPLPPEHAERALCLVAGPARLAGTPLQPGRVYLLAAGAPAVLEGDGPARLVLFGGAPLDGPRRLWWNFAASDPALIAAARERWAAGGFAPVPGEHEAQPLPVR